MPTLHSEVPHHPARARWALAVLLAAYILSFVDRNVMAILIGPIRRDFDISDAQYGLLHGLAFVAFYTLLGLPLGRLADRGSRRTIVGVGVLFWSAMTCACGVAGSFGALFAARMGVGVGEAALAPPAHSLLTDLFPRERLPRAMSIFTLGITIGGGMAYMIGGWVYGAFEGAEVVLPVVGALRPWQLTFLVVGAPGFLVGALAWTLREPPRTGLGHGAGEAVPLSALLHHLRVHARIYAAVIGSIGLLSVLGYANMTWYVEMLIRRFGGERAAIGGAFGAMFIVVGSAGALAGGQLALALGRRYPDANVRLLVWVGIAWVLPGVAGPLMPTEAGALYLDAPVLFLLNSYFGAAIAALQLVTPNELRAQVSALMLFLTNLLGLGLGPWLVGFLSDRVVGELHLALAMVSGVFAPLAAALAATALRPYAALIERTERAT